MIKKITLLVFLFSSLFMHAQVEKFSRLRIFLDQIDVFQLLRNEINIDHGKHHKNYIENDFSEADIRKLKNLGVRYEVLIDDVSHYYATQSATKSALGGQSCPLPSGQTQFNAPSNFSLGSMGGYLTYQQMLNQLDSMKAKYPQLISSRKAIDSTILTHENRFIYWVRISDNPEVQENEPEGFYNAVHHAREPMGLSQLIYYMWYLLENYQTDPNIRNLIENTQLYFVPCVNPDGYIYNQTTNPNGGGMWRKNRRNNGGSFGVDLNRNYGTFWAYDNVGSSGTASSDTYRGPSAFSEPETRNIRNFANAHNFIVQLNYHSYGNLLIYPWAYNGLETLDSAFYRRAARVMTKYNAYTTGTGTTTVGYNSNGDTDDWAYGEQIQKNKILSMTPEAGDNSLGFWPASTEILRICDDNLWQNLSYAYMLLNFGMAEETSSNLLTQLNNKAKYSLNKYGFGLGNLQVSIVPVSNNIISVGSPVTLVINQLQTQFDSITYQLSPAINSGDQVVFLLRVDNLNGLVFEDTIIKTFGNFNPVFVDNANNLNNWQNQGTGSVWNTTTQRFYSSPSSITDSPTGNYANNANTTLVLRNTVNLYNAIDASFGFWTRFDLENDYDFVQVLASGDNAVFTPLCGLYTNEGTVDQRLGEPLFDGQQLNWVQESMSLQSFLGDSTVYIKFNLRSDNAVRADGFYFDDAVLNVLYNNPTASQTERRFIPLLGQNFPNPADYQLFIPIEGLTQTDISNYSLVVTDALGRLMLSKKLNENHRNGVHVEVGDWPNGNYFYTLQGEEMQSTPKKLQIVR
jgi:carboxypeptidase T